METDNLELPQLEAVELQHKGKKSKYVLVKTRLQYFRKHYQNGSISTEILHFDKDTIMMKASVFINGQLVSTGIAHEDKDAGYVNKTSFVEVCETSAVGRALGIQGIGISESVATYDEVMRAIKQQEQMERNDELLQYKAESLSSRLIASIEADDDVGVDEVEKDYKSNAPLATRVKLSLSPEHLEYMDERKERLSAERKAKKEKKEADNQAFAKEHAKKQKAK